MNLIAAIRNKIHFVFIYFTLYCILQIMAKHLEKTKNFLT